MALIQVSEICFMYMYIYMCEYVCLYVYVSYM